MHIRELRVSGSTNHKKLAGKIMHSLNEGYDIVHCISIGPFPSSQCDKAIIAAKEMAIGQGRTLRIDMMWKNIETIRNDRQMTVSAMVKTVRFDA